MNEQRMEDVKDTAIKLSEIRLKSPEYYFYLNSLFGIVWLLNNCD